MKEERNCIDKTVFSWYFHTVITNCTYFMNSSNTFLSLFKRRSVQALAAVLVVAGSAFAYFSFGSAPEEQAAEAADPQVTLTTANQYAGGESISLIGTVRAFTEAAVTSERSGRVTRVNATLGQTVGAGQVLATLENAAESAAVLQAEGAYDAAVAARAQAVAAAEQNTVGVDESQNAIANAKNSAISTYRSAYNTVNGIVLNNIDPFFTSPRSPVPGLRIDGEGNTKTLNETRVEFQTLLPQWEAEANAISPNSDLVAKLEAEKAYVQKAISFVDTFISVFNRQGGNSRYTDAELQSFSSNFTGLRANLISTQSAIDSAIVGIQSARDTENRAEIGVSVSGVPAAEAQIKQALGSLRSAQASYARTVLRTPISGTVNEISIKAGDYVNVGQKIAEVANNNALEIVTFVGDAELPLLTVGDTVLIENKYEGTITQIAPSVDATTRKTEVRIATENNEIKNGDTVTITKEVAVEENTSAIVVPLTAVKFEIKDGFMFTVEDNILVQKPVTLGVVRGSSVEVLEGLTANEQFVVDARGLLPGNAVSVEQ